MSELFRRGAYLKVGGTAVTARGYGGFRITFDVEKTSESNPNPARVSIYNLKPETRAEFESAKLIMALHAGYFGIPSGPPLPGKLLPQLYIGDVKRVNTARQGPDIVTTFEAGDGETAIKETTIEKTYAEGTTTQNVIVDIAKKMGVAVGNIATTTLGLFQNGFSASGMAGDNLTNITEKLGLEWNITDNELNILAPNQPTLEPVVLVNKNTGLIGVPSKTDKGIEFNNLLNPDIKPGRAIKIESIGVNGVFRVRKAQYTGDTNGGEFVVKVEAVP